MEKKIRNNKIPSELRKRLVKIERILSEKEIENDISRQRTILTMITPKELRDKGIEGSNWRWHFDPKNNQDVNLELYDEEGKTLEILKLSEFSNTVKKIANIINDLLKEK